jgi:hypothetical protein
MQFRENGMNVYCSVEESAVAYQLHFLLSKSTKSKKVTIQRNIKPVHANIHNAEKHKKNILRLHFVPYALRHFL